jgi:dTDP-4-dehydrorhamnose 3,5-epimerase
MPFSFLRASIPDVIIIDPCVFPDERGYFMETYKRSEFAAAGITDLFVQCNQSKSSKGILRGLHFQSPPKAQGKLIRILDGEIYDVAVDIRKASPTFGRWVSVALSVQTKRMVYVPPGFAHGFCVTSEDAEIQYMTTEEYSPDFECGLIWNDPDLGIDWPITAPILSSRDRAWPVWRDAVSLFV